MSFAGPGYVQSIGSASPVMMQQPPAVADKMQNAIFRYGEQALWSSHAIGAGETLANQTLRVFSTPLSQNGQGYSSKLSLAETNLRVSGQLPQSQAFDVYGMAVQIAHFSGSSVDAAAQNQPANTAETIADLVGILNQCVISWDFTSANIPVAPAMLIGAGGGAFGAVATTQNATDRGHMNNGAGTYWLYNAYPVALPPLTSFAVLATFGSRAAVFGAKAGALRICLLGYYKNWIDVA